MKALEAGMEGIEFWFVIFLLLIAGTMALSNYFRKSKK
jgi:hypothetical protein